MVKDLKQAVERLHNCQASFLEDVAMVEKFGDKNVWSGVVSVFFIKGHHQADKCYAWSSPIEGSTKRRITISGFVFLLRTARMLALRLRTEIVSI